MKTVRILFTVIFMVAISTVALAQSKIAVVNVPKCTVMSEAGKKANDELKAFEDSLAAKIKPIEEELQKMGKEIQSQEKVLTEDAKKKKIEAYQKKAIELETLYRQSQSQMQAKNEEVIAPIMQDLEEAIKKVADAGKYDIVLQIQAVIYAPGAKDISDDVIKEYDKMFKAKKK